MAPSPAARNCLLFATTASCIAFASRGSTCFQLPAASPRNRLGPPLPAASPLRYSSRGIWQRAVSFAPDRHDEVDSGTKSLNVSFQDYVYLMARRLLGILFFLGLYSSQRALGIASPILGMLVVFSSLLALERIDASAGLAMKAFSLLEPGYRFLVKWIVVFFVPALVKVSLLDASIGAADLWHVFVLLTVGFFATCCVTAAVASIWPPADASTPSEQGPLPSRSARIHQQTLLRAPYARFLAGMFISAAVAEGGVWHEVAQASFMICASLLGFNAGKRMPAAVKTYVHPLFICAGATFASAAAWAARFGDGLGMMDLIRTYCTWPGGGALLNQRLLPTTVVSLGCLLFENRALLKRDFKPIMLSALTSTAFTIASAPVLAHILGLPRPLALAAVSRCAMSPMALEVADVLGTHGALAVAMTTFSGLLGVVMREPLFHLLRLRPGRSRARGLALGCSGHGISVVPMASYDKQSFAYGCVAFILVGPLTAMAVRVPLIRSLLLSAMPA